MLFNSGEFLVFFPVVVFLYFVFPRKVRQYWLLAASYYFYMCWNARYIVLILFSTCITYAGGIVLEKIRTAKEGGSARFLMKSVVALILLLNLGLLFYYKYFDFSLRILEHVLPEAVCMRISSLGDLFGVRILPVGISFYTFQALGYILDVYRGDVEAEQNFFRYALFVSFFPQLVAGPIERSKNLLSQLREPKDFRFENAREGLLLMLWGYFLKIVVADRIAMYVDTVYSDVFTYSGTFLLVAALLFPIQIYCDFYGYSVIAMGAAKVLGIQLMENFNAPFLATSIADHWRRWHISLTTWFRDYVYIPLGGNRKGIVRKYINILIVFMLSGLWHGASFAYVIWGGLNGVYQVLGEIFAPVRRKVLQLLQIDPDSASHHFFRIVVTYLLCSLSLVFFRAGDTGSSVDALRAMTTIRNPWVFFDGSLYTCGLDRPNFLLMLLGIAVVFAADICKEKKIVIRDVILRQNVLFRWLVFDAAVVFILVFGIWGSAYNAASFIYFQF